MSAAFCVAYVQVVFTGVPGLGSARNSSLSDVGVTSPSGALREHDDARARRTAQLLVERALHAAVPDQVARATSPGFLSTSSLKASSTVPSSARANARVGARSRLALAELRAGQRRRCCGLICR